MKSFVKILLTLLLMIGVGVAIYMSVSKQSLLNKSKTIIGLSGSEKLPFFHDAQTIETFRNKPYFLDVDVQKAGSRQIATSYDVSKYDFVFPAGIPAAEKLRKEKNLKKSYAPFNTPMVIASWKPIAKILQNNGLVNKKDDVYFIDMPKLLKLMIQKTKWSDLKNNDAYPANKSILVTTTDVRKSNSAAMYLSLSSYILNNNEIVQTKATADALESKLASLFLRQGYTEHSSASPFANYLSMGPGKSPLVMIYESQFLYELAKSDASAISKDMVLLYPKPTIFTKHTLLPTTKEGEVVGEALSNNITLQKIAVKHGLRTQNIQLFKEFIKKSHIKIPSQLYDVIEPPSYEILEYMIQSIEKDYQ